MNKKNSGKIKQHQSNWPLELRVVYSLTKSKRYFRVVQALFILIHIALFIYGLYGKYFIYQTLLTLDPTGQKIVTAINFSSDTLSLLLGVYYMLFVITKLKNMIDFFPPKIDLDDREENKCRRFKILLNVMHAACFFPIIVNIYLFVRSVGWQTYSFYLGSDLLHRHTHAVAANYLFLAHEIVCRYFGINNKLERLSHTYGLFQEPIMPAANLINIVQYNSPQKFVQELVRTVKHYEIISNYLDDFNRYFRALMVIIFMTDVFTIFFCLSFIIEFSIVDLVPNMLNAQTYTNTLCCLFILMTAGQIVLIASVGEKLQEQAQRTLTLCLTLLSKLPVVKKVETDILIEKQLNFLMDQCRSRKICFHAAGCFVINWAILGSIISTVATYSIVIIQFLLKK